MSCFCLRPSLTLSGATYLRLLGVSSRCYGTKPTAAQPPVQSREQAVDNAHGTASKKATKQAAYARHWLRAILRECTYLPDPKARQFVSQYVLSRFRTYQFKTWKSRNMKNIHGLEGRLKDKQKELRLFHRLLNRANEGETKPLLKVLFMTYGRTGKRRHDLMIPLLAKPAQEDSDLTAMYNQDGELVWNEGATGQSAKSDAVEDKYRLSPALYALALSQQKIDPPDRTRPNPRKLRPDIPELNSKMRPMPASRVNNLTKKWYAELLDRVLPPLPADEWYKLQDLANGRGISTKPQKRKAPADAVSIATRKGTALDMVVQGDFDKREFGNPEAHTITARYMQRLYALVFKQCPMMDYDSERGKWSVTWGKYAVRPYRIVQDRQDPTIN
ncbi:hypothetical protein M409DRAFT_28397 [Zasmidium cellare ATCC 36951]|uniref:LYR motif-containing protein Cup1-like N-terminal domain-containing protein n=1 Tax=Zasmidium cellare ATCC 36951 TaxID=1080233 RepID=A0A6A6C1X4_ZASCE|nr:uncharacterized protein M409DRAFT_28397 [Zasmidium cellare ATCC 36951]KAF2161067.1 hypothetical protein M409DRAFT_28397 [Zasmidium cellare ATCC 36951]